MLRTLWLVIAHNLVEYRFMDDTTGNFSQEPFTKKKNKETETKRVLYNLKMPKVKENFTKYNYHSMSSLWETRR